MLRQMIREELSKQKRPGAKKSNNMWMIPLVAALVK
jgi:hypothetical protein